MPKKILIVEDSSFQRSHLLAALKGTGYEIREATHVEEALTLIESQKPDCVLTDLVMPGKSGLEMIRTLKEKNSGIPVPVLTADIQEPVREECQSLGVRGFLNKPWKPAALLATLQEILGK